MKFDKPRLSDHFSYGKIFAMTASPILMMIFSSLYSIVDGFFASNFVGKSTFTAVNLIFPLS